MRRRAELRPAPQVADKEVQAYLDDLRRVILILVKEMEELKAKKGSK